MNAPHIPIPPCAAPGAPNPVRKTGRTLRWGIVGTGNIATKITEDIARLEDAFLQCVSSRHEASAIEFADQFGVARAVFDNSRASGYTQLVEDPEVDVVYVAAPQDQHFEISRAALLAGKNVLCEKPLTTTAREAEDLIGIASARGLFLMEGVWTRFLPCVNRIWEILASGELGDVQWVQADLGLPSGPGSGSRHGDAETGGGALLDLTVYPLTLAVGALGFPEGMSAVGALSGAGIDRQNALLLTYPTGAAAQLMSSLISPGTRTATFSGAKGWLRTGAPLHNPVELTVAPFLGDQRVERFPQVGNGYTYELREATRCIQSGLPESPTMSWDHSLQTMRLFDEARTQMGVHYANDGVVLRPPAHR